MAEHWEWRPFVSCGRGADPVVEELQPPSEVPKCEVSLQDGVVIQGHEPILPFQRADEASGEFAPVFLYIGNRETLSDVG